jgi:hypothetical protein
MQHLYMLKQACRDHFPELRSNLVAALACLDVDKLAHGGLI